MKTLKTNQITLLENVETAEAEKIYNNKKLKYSFLFIIPFVSLICFLICVIYESQQTQLIETSQNFFVEAFKNKNAFIAFSCLTGISFWITIINIIIYQKKLKPYKDLLEIAKTNDKIRHEEKIREKERQRIKNQTETNYTLKDIENTKKQGE